MDTLTPLLELTREDRIHRLATLFPRSLHHDSVAEAERLGFQGGRTEAVARLTTIDPVAYAHSRNHVGGAVTRLSPWLRHGVLTLAEVRDAALARVQRPIDAEKLISELGWRDYWRQVYYAIGTRIGSDIEPPAARPRVPTGPSQMPDDVLEARTGMDCIDAFVRHLHRTGWLHNHERMWLASWIVHVRGIPWRTGADWFLSHLVDADPASNHLSWQWVAGTFSAKPYLFNRENLERFTAGSHCRACPVLGACPVEGSYDDLSARLFVADPPVTREPLRIRPAALPKRPAHRTMGRPLVWLTLDSLADTSPAAALHPDAPRLFVLDPRWLADEKPSLKRLAFIADCLAEIDGVEVVMADPRKAVPELARAHHCSHVTVASTPCPAIQSTVAAVEATIPVVTIDEAPFCDRSGVSDLGRFSRYWSRVSRSALAPTAPP